MASKNKPKDGTLILSGSALVNNIGAIQLGAHYARKKKRLDITVKAGCPKCKAYPGSRCRDEKSNTRKGPHIERIRLYHQLMRQEKSS